MLAKKLTALAAAGIAATVIAAGVASAGPNAPSIDSLPTASVQKATFYHTGRYCRFGTVLPRHLVRIKLRYQGYRYIRGLRYVPGRVLFIGGLWRRTPGFYVAFAKRGFGPGYFRLRVNACTGYVVSTRGPIFAGGSPYGY